jgi:hypothetical protein
MVTLFKVTDLAAEAVLEGAAKKCPRKTVCPKKSCCKASCRRTTAGPSTCGGLSVQCPKKGTAQAVEELLMEVQALAKRRDIEATVMVHVSSR